MTATVPVRLVSRLTESRVARPGWCLHCPCPRLGLRNELGQKGSRTTGRSKTEAREKKGRSEDGVLAASVDGPGWMMGGRVGDWIQWMARRTGRFEITVPLSTGGARSDWPVCPGLPPEPRHRQARAQFGLLEACNCVAARRLQAW